MKAELITHYGDDLSPVNAARVSFANESQWEELEVMSLLTPSDVTDDLRGWRFTGEVREGHEHGIDVYRRLSAKDDKLIDYLAKNKHTSCFEHQGATLRLKVPIFIARQIQRHRTFAYNEISRRYVDTPPEFFWPDKWRKRAANVKQGSSEEEIVPAPMKLGWTHAPLHVTPNDIVAATVSMYTHLLEQGVAPEQARMILPQNMYTEFYMTGNLRNWAHFLKLRLDAHAQIEVQEIAKMVEGILRPLFPVSVEALLKYD